MKDLNYLKNIEEWEKDVEEQHYGSFYRKFQYYHTSVTVGREVVAVVSIYQPKATAPGERAGWAVFIELLEEGRHVHHWDTAEEGVENYDLEEAKEVAIKKIEEAFNWYKAKKS